MYSIGQNSHTQIITILFYLPRVWNTKKFLTCLVDLSATHRQLKLKKIGWVKEVRGQVVASQGWTHPHFYTLFFFTLYFKPTPWTTSLKMLTTVTKCLFWIHSLILIIILKKSQSLLGPHLNLFNSQLVL